MKIESRCLPAFVNNDLNRKPEIMKSSSIGVVCLVMASLFSTPSSRRAPLNPPLSARLTRAEKQDTSGPKVDLKWEEGTVCSGAPDFAKGVTLGPPPALKPPPADMPVFEKDRKQTVLSLIHYPWEDLGFNIVFMGSRSGYRAMTLTARRRIEIYVRPGEGEIRQAYDLAHELGHAFDLKYNDDERHRKWCELRGIKPSTPWYGCNACPDYNTPAGDFAETFAFLLLGPGNYHSVIAPLPKPDQISELAAFCKIEQLSDTLTASAPKKKSELNAVQSAIAGYPSPPDR